jgi:hypothetical protein
VCAGKQKCLVHLLGDMKKVEKYKDKTKDWRAFSNRLKRLLRDAMRLCGRRSSLEKATCERRCALIEKRLTELIDVPWENGQAQRLVKRLRRHRAELLVFLYNEDVPFDNNHAERVIRNAVVMRKNSYSNRSLTGAETQAILMSIFQTLKQRKVYVTNTIANALRKSLIDKKLPTMKEILENSAE